MVVTNIMLQLFILAKKILMKMLLKHLLQAIEQAETEWPKPDATQPMYNVMGQRVSEGYQGVIIQNGHKYLIP